MNFYLIITWVYHTHWKTYHVHYQLNHANLFLEEIKDIFLFYRFSCPIKRLPKKSLESQKAGGQLPVDGSFDNACNDSLQATGNSTYLVCALYPSRFSSPLIRRDLSKSKFDCNSFASQASIVAEFYE